MFNIPNKIKVSNTHKIISNKVLPNLISKLVEEECGSFKNLINISKSNLSSVDIEKFVFFVWVLILNFRSNKENPKSLKIFYIKQFLDKFEKENNDSDLLLISSLVRNNIIAFCGFYNEIISNNFNSMLLEGWVEIFSDVSEEMNQIRDISVGAIIGHEKAISMDVLKPAPPYIDSRRLPR